MAPRSTKRMRMTSTSGFGFGSGKVLSQNLAAIPSNRMASSFRKCTSSRSKSRSRNDEDEGTKSAGIFRKCTASRSKSRKEEELEHHKLAELRIVVRVCNDKKKYRFSTLSCYDQKWSSQSNYLRSPFPEAIPELRGSCNGLLCFEFHTRTRFSNGIGMKRVVLEPSTGAFQLIPQPSSMNRPCYCSSKYCCLNVSTMGSGLHFDSHSGDYKYFCFTTNFYLHKDDEGYNYDGFHEISEHVQVYSVKNNSWKELSYPLHGNEKIVAGGMGTCVNGVCYWRAHCKNDCSFILAFNFVTEEFSSFHGPKLNRGDTYSLVELDAGSLGLLIYPNVRDARWRGIISLMVYSSSSSSWSRSVDSGFEEVAVVGFHKPVWFGKRNGSYSLLLKGPEGDLLEYDYTRKVFSKIMTHSFNVFAYETQTKNNANIWHKSSFHEVEVQKRFAVYASDQRGNNY